MTICEHGTFSLKRESHHCSMCLSAFLQRLLVLLCISKSQLFIMCSVEKNVHRQTSKQLSVSNVATSDTRAGNTTQKEWRENRHFHLPQAAQATKKISMLDTTLLKPLSFKLTTTQHAHNQAHKTSHFSRLYRHPLTKRLAKRVNKERRNGLVVGHSIHKDVNPEFISKHYYFESFFDDIQNDKNTKIGRIRKLNYENMKREKRGKQEKWKRLVVVRPLKVFQVSETTKKSLFKLEKNYLETFSIKHKTSSLELAPQTIFDIDDLTGMVKLKKGKSLDFEKVKSIDFTILIARLDDYSCKWG